MKKGQNGGEIGKGEALDLGQKECEQREREREKMNVE